VQIGFIFILIIAIFIAIFAIQNGTPVPVDLFFARYEMPLAVIMMICLILGAVIVLILGTTRQFKKRSEQKELMNKIKTFETEKAQHDISVKALESDKQNLKKTNEELNAKITELNDRIKMQEELLAERVRELEAVKAQNINEIEKVTEIIDEGAAKTDNENSEVESQ
jgi:uncharacterized integral membrane protein